MPMSNLPNKMNLWVQCKYNVLLIGKHGIGKTHLVLQAFNNNNLKYRYFSASTMDPWVDFIGVPKEIKREGQSSYLGMIRPKEFEDDEVEAIFFDEFNRAPEKVRNAVMELLQFKSINGRRFNNLKIIWAAINPDDEENTYDVDRLDPAQKDRFEVIYELPYKPDIAYFTEKYGNNGKTACEWWDTLPEAQKDQVSPRRLDYAMDAYNKGVDLTDVLPKDVRPKTLKSMIEQVGVTLTHDERWRQDPDLYINTLANRADKTDVADAFDALQQLSYDQAVAYVTKLPPNKLKQIATDDRTRQIIFGTEPNKTTSSALKTVKLTDQQLSVAMQDSLINLQTIQPEFATLLARTQQDKLHIEVWDAIRVNLQRGVDENAAFLAMVAACVRLQTTPKGAWVASNKLVMVVLKTIHDLFTYYRSVRPDMLRIDPVLIHEAVYFVNNI